MAHHFLLPAIATIMVAILLFLSPPTAANSAVVDWDGNPLEVGSQYYVLTACWGPLGRGGLTYRSKLPQLCPTYVGQHSAWKFPGHTVSFSPANSSQEQISEGDDVNIVFNCPDYCNDTGAWRLTLDNETLIPYVSTNGSIGNSGAEASWFKIEKYNAISTYKIVYCFPFTEPKDIIMGGKEEICEQLDATQPGPNDVSFLSLVPIGKPLPFSGFVFKKAVPPTPTAYY